MGQQINFQLGTIQGNLSGDGVGALILPYYTTLPAAWGTERTVYFANFQEFEDKGVTDENHIMQVSEFLRLAPKGGYVYLGLPVLAGDTASAIQDKYELMIDEVTGFDTNITLVAIDDLVFRADVIGKLNELCVSKYNTEVNKHQSIVIVYGGFTGDIEMEDIPNLRTSDKQWVFPVYAADLYYINEIGVDSVHTAVGTALGMLCKTSIGQSIAKTTEESRIDSSDIFIEPAIIYSDGTDAKYVTQKNKTVWNMTFEQSFALKGLNIAVRYNGSFNSSHFLSDVLPVTGNKVWSKVQHARIMSRVQRNIADGFLKLKNQNFGSKADKTIDTDGESALKTTISSYTAQLVSNGDVKSVGIPEGAVIKGNYKDNGEVIVPILVGIYTPFQGYVVNMTFKNT